MFSLKLIQSDKNVNHAKVPNTLRLGVVDN